jgi:hypothetical protein
MFLDLTPGPQALDLTPDRGAATDATCLIVAGKAMFLDLTPHLPGLPLRTPD